jgi:Hydantoinase/oxoprolinase N-terminal region
MSYRLGVDVGGTFTDLVLVSPDGVARTCKVLSTTADYARAIVDGVRQLTTQAGIPARDIGEIIHGTTVATNAILERRGARTGLLTTEGFRDLLEIGRLRLSRLYDLDFERPAPLVPRRWRREVRERMSHRGEPASQVHADRAEWRRLPARAGRCRRLGRSVRARSRARAARRAGGEGQRRVRAAEIRRGDRRAHVEDRVGGDRAASHGGEGVPCS